jgi:hypothetical protein
MTVQERAAFALLSDPPEVPPALAPTPDPGTPPVPLEVVQLGPDRQPVLAPDGTPQLFTVRLDHLGRFVTDEAGRPAITGQGSIVVGEDGRPILLTVERGPSGQLVREFFGNVKLVPVPPPRLRNPAFVVGDSVILGAESALPDALLGWSTIVDAQESRLTGRTAEVVRSRRGEIGRVAVVMIGHNSGSGENHEASIRAVLAELAGVERVVWVTAAEWSPGQIEFNDALAAVAESGEFPSLYVVDWALHNTAYPSYTYDGLHLTPEGREVLADVVAAYLGPAPD